MSRKMLGMMAAAIVSCAFGLANAQEPLKLTDKQLGKVTAGAFNAQVPIAAGLLGNGAGPGGINQFSPSTATLTQTQVALGLNLFTIDGASPLTVPMATPAPIATPAH